MISVTAAVGGDLYDWFPARDGCWVRVVQRSPAAEPVVYHFSLEVRDDRLVGVLTHSGPRGDRTRRRRDA